jgi:hypothetical protein
VARRIPGENDTGVAKLEVKRTPNPGIWDVYATTSTERLEQMGFDTSTFSMKPIKLITIDETAQRVVLHPRYMTPMLDGSFNQKHKKITSISFDLSAQLYNRVADDPTEDDIYDAMKYLPEGMTSDPNFGLGIKKEYRFVLDAVAQITPKQIVYIGNKEPLAGEFKIQRKLYGEIIAEINRMDGRAKYAENEVKATTAFNMLAQTGGVEPRPFNLGRHRIRQLITRFMGDDAFEDTEIQEELVTTVSRVARDLLRANPQASAKLVSEIQISRLELAAQKYEQMLEQSLSEGVWQKFFEDNPFLLSFAFGYPVTFVNKHPYVGGMNITGRGENIGDFLYKNTMNNNAALIEIKKPSTPLLREYRQNVYGPHHELSGGIVQTLNQRHELTNNFPIAKMNNKWHGDSEVNAFDIDCVLVVGTMPKDDHQRRSFQLYRRNSHVVNIFTFDEVFQKLNQLISYLKGENQNPEQLPMDPF